MLHFISLYKLSNFFCYVISSSEIELDTAVSPKEVASNLTFPIEYVAEKSHKNPRSQLVGVTEIPGNSAFVAHLASLPAVGALNGLISSFPIPKIFASNGIPLSMYYRDRNEK